MKSFKTFISDEYDQYLNNQLDKYTWSPNDIHVNANYTQGQVAESIEDHEEWLGTTDHNEKIPSGSGADEITTHLNRHINSTKKLYKSAGILTSEAEALNHYIGTGYVEMNHLNRHGRLPDSHPDNPEMATKLNYHNDKLDNGIKRQATEHPIHLWRGMGGEGKFNLKPGDTFHDKGFVSTSTRPRIARIFARNFDKKTGDIKDEVQHVAHIKVPKGSSVLHALTHDKSASRTENEVILPRNSKFRYDGHTEHEDPNNSYYNPSGKIIVHHLTHIPEKDND